MTTKELRKDIQDEIQALHERTRMLCSIEQDLFYFYGLCGHDSPDYYSFGLEYDDWTPKTIHLALMEWKRRK